MQTFLPYEHFGMSASCLDQKRLGKQRVECLQILKSLTIPEYGWKNHPAVKMWKGYEQSLCTYGDAICNEWIRRGYKDTCLDQIIIIKTKIILQTGEQEIKPPWLGNKIFHDSHKSNLLRKNPEYYSKFNWNVENNLPYYWPTKVEKKQK